MEDGGLGEVIGLVVDQETAAVGRDIEKIGLTWGQRSVLTLHQELMQRVFCTVEVCCAVGVPYLWRV